MPAVELFVTVGKDIPVTLLVYPLTFGHFLTSISNLSLNVVKAAAFAPFSSFALYGEVNLILNDCAAPPSKTLLRDDRNTLLWF